ncbi:MAG: small ribosomal subunit Rsm22 family protein [Bacilli bacterium]|nr:small ribosomal subunit Rsm22 family protein [Bacilli bacterium]
MQLPFSIKLTIEELVKDYEIANLRKIYERLSSIYLDEKINSDRVVMCRSEALTYAITRLPATFQASSKALEKTLLHYPNQISSVLEIGAGLCLNSVAFKHLLIDLKQITMIEREKAMIEIGQEINKDSDVNIINDDFVNHEYQNHYDLVFASYALNELSEEDLKKTLDKIWDITDGVLLIVEPGTPHSFSMIQKIKHHIINKGGNIIAPCQNNNICSLSDGDWCHFLTRVSRSRLQKLIKQGEVPYEDEKFCFVAFSKKPYEITKHTTLINNPHISGNQLTFLGCKNNAIELIKVSKNNKDLFKKIKKMQSLDEVNDNE